MAWVNFYNCQNAASTTLTDSIGTNNGTLAGSTLPTINANGYLFFNGGNGGTAGDRSRVTLNNADYTFTHSSAFTIILKFRVDTSMPNSTAGMIQTFQRNAADNNGLGFVYYNSLYAYVIQLSTSTGGAKNKQYYNSADDQLGRIETMIISYNNNTWYININGADKTAFTINNTLNGNMYVATSKSIIGAEYTSATSNYRSDFKGDVFLSANKNDAMSIGSMKTYSAYMKGIV